jgi:flagellar biosynthesis anti-sigma factor FlgM
MKIFQRGPADSDVAKLVQNDKKLNPAQRRVDANVGPSAESAKVSISDRARQLQRIAELARQGDELRAEKVQKLKEQIHNGEYRPDAEDVAKDIIRSAVTGLPQKK